MKTITASGQQAYFDQAVSIVLEFRLGGLIVTPDEGSVTYSVRSTSESLISEKSLPAWDTAIDIPAEHHAKASDELSSPRFVDISFMEDSVPRSVSWSYVLVEQLPLTVTPDNIRDILGVSALELPDESINFYGTYRKLTDSLDLNIFEDASLNYEANELIKYREAYDQARKLQFKVLQRIRIDDQEKHRDMKMRLGDLVQVLEEEYAVASTVFEGSEDSTPLVQFGSGRTDPITGA